MKQQPEHKLTDQVKLLQKAVLISNEKILLLKRSEDAYSRPHCWDLPGGNSEWPSSPEFTRGLHLEDLVREIQEETGISIPAEAVFQRDLVFFDTTFQPEKQMFTVLVGWKHVLNGTEPQVTISNEHSAYSWVSPNDIAQYDFGFAQFIPKMIRRAIAQV